ncbi:hypothetical protein ACIHCQ_23820 [Streptomyces sp. NPDC052236]|uniref:hypothetical protein n=1 Tax=Streptomyces sp. NPDC052236 TaxID=3365686 RepID=UPI0037D8E335
MTSPRSRSLTEDGVSAKTATALRAAMQRLFGGRLTKENLWREAQVSRATMSRATTILTEWDNHIAEHGTTTPGEARLEDS